MALLVDPRFIRYSDFQRLRDRPDEIVYLFEQDVYYLADDDSDRCDRFWCYARVKTSSNPPSVPYVQVKRETDHWLCLSGSPLDLTSVQEKTPEALASVIYLTWQHYVRRADLKEGTPYFLRGQDILKERDGWEFFVVEREVWFTDLKGAETSISIIPYGNALWSPDFEQLLQTANIMGVDDADGDVIFVRTDHHDLAMDSFDQLRSRCKYLLRWFPFVISTIIMDYFWMTKIASSPICDKARYCFLSKRAPCFPFYHHPCGIQMGLFMDSSTQTIFPLLHMNTKIEISESDLDDHDHFQVAIQWHNDGSERKKRKRML